MMVGALKVWIWHHGASVGLVVLIRCCARVAWIASRCCGGGSMGLYHPTTAAAGFIGGLGLDGVDAGVILIFP